MPFFVFVDWEEYFRGRCKTRDVVYRGLSLLFGFANWLSARNMHEYAMVHNL
jgi:hypothetical protein